MLRRLDVFGEIVYKTRNFIRVQHQCRSMAPRVPVTTKLTVRTNAEQFYVGDLIAVRSPEDNSVLIRSVAASPGTDMVSSDPEDSPFTLGSQQYWVKAIQPDALDSSDFGPIDADTQILGRAVHCSTTSHLINNSDAGKADDKEDQWVIPLVPNSMRDLAVLWKMTGNDKWVNSVLPEEHPLHQPDSSGVMNPAT